MTELEKVEKLREKANVSYEEAKEALEIANGDILDALIYLERQGKTNAPDGGGFFSSAGGSHSYEQQPPPDSDEYYNKHAENFSDLLRKIGKFIVLLFKKSVTNYLDATKDGRLMFTCPVIVLVVFVIFFFWVTIPLFIISLFFGFRYRFRGVDLGRDSVNRVMDDVSEMAEDVKKNFGKKDNDTDDYE